MEHMISPEAVNRLMKERKTVTPEFFTSQPIPREIIEQLLENATWAPNHKKTQPWLFKIFLGKGRECLGDYMAAYYRDHTPAEKFSEVKLKQTKQKCLQSACVIAICMKRSTTVDIPEWEEIAAVACAVENLWLSATAYGLAGYWSSTESMLAANSFLGLGEGERCLGVFYLGYAQAPDTARKRIPVAEKISWVEE